jgi:uncharacterized membrane protein HdeD (DUF308 family)
MAYETSSHWWAIALRGVAAIAFGLLAWIWPDATVFALVILFGVYALTDGVFNIMEALSTRAEGSDRVWLLARGLLAVGVGLVTMAWPDISTLSLLYVIAAWAIVTGVLEVVAAVRLRSVIDGELFLALSGTGSILFGPIAFIFPGAGAVALIWLIGVYAITFGLLLLAVALRLWTEHRRHPGSALHPSA